MKLSLLPQVILISGIVIFLLRNQLNQLFLYYRIMKKYYNPKETKYHFKLYSYNGPPHNVSKLIKSTSYETTEQALLLYYVNKNDNVIELGANIGTSSILLSKILQNSEKQHFAVEPNIDILKILEKNKKLNNSNFNIIPGIISPEGEFYLEGDGWEGHIVKHKTSRKVRTFDYDELDSKYNFNVLFADCEGSLSQLLIDYPNIHKKLRLIIYERDGGGNYSKVDGYFHNKNFKKVFDSGHHCVFEKKNNHLIDK